MIEWKNTEMAYQIIQLVLNLVNFCGYQILKYGNVSILLHTFFKRSCIYKIYTYFATIDVLDSRFPEEEIDEIAFGN